MADTAVECEVLDHIFLGHNIMRLGANALSCQVSPDIDMFEAEQNGDRLNLSDRI